MNELKKFDELSQIDRNAPCQEYPGDWFISFPGRDGKSRETSEALSSVSRAIEKALKIIQSYEDMGLEYNPRDFSISWRCSDDDPRIGQVWFTGYYTHGRFNFYGEYRQT